MNTNNSLKVEVAFPCKHEMEEALARMRAWAHENESREGFTYSTLGSTTAHSWVTVEEDFRALLAQWRARGISFRAAVEYH